MKTKQELVVDAIFLIALALVVSGLIINISISGSSAETAQEPTTEATTAETTEYITEHTEPVTEATEPSSGLYDVPLDTELQLHIISEAVEHDIDPAIIFAMAFHESTYKADNIGDGGNSYGLLQVQPKWHWERMKRFGCTDKDGLLDPYMNVTVAVDYLAEQIARYGDLAKGLTAYNKGHYAGTITNYAKNVMATAKEMAVM